jgi:hypothetical protein
MESSVSIAAERRQKVCVGRAVTLLPEIEATVEDDGTA